MHTLNKQYIEQLKDDLFLLCRYDRDEPNHMEYNLALLNTIDKMSLESVMYALEDLKGLNQ